jgi:hypothetical protein
MNVYLGDAYSVKCKNKNTTNIYSEKIFHNIHYEARYDIAIYRAHIMAW